MIEEDTVVEVSMDPLSWLRKQLETADVDLLHERIRTLAETLDTEVAAFRSRPLDEGP